MFGHLADPNGANNALSQVLYGLALRYDPLPLSLFTTFISYDTFTEHHTKIKIKATDGAAPQTQS